MSQDQKTECSVESVNQNELDRLTTTFNELEIEHVVRTNGEWQYVFVTAGSFFPSSLLMTVEALKTMDIDRLLCCGLPRFEFENGKLAAYG